MSEVKVIARFKTGKEFIDEFGVQWRDEIKWTFSMDPLLGLKIPLEMYHYIWFQCPGPGSIVCLNDYRAEFENLNQGRVPLFALSLLSDKIFEQVIITKDMVKLKTHQDSENDESNSVSLHNQLLKEMKEMVAKNFGIPSWYLDAPDSFHDDKETVKMGEPIYNVDRKIYCTCPNCKGEGSFKRRWGTEKCFACAGKGKISNRN